MNKRNQLLLVSSLMLGVANAFAQTTVPFDILKANDGSDKSIIWTPITTGSGYGHKIYSFDAGGRGELRFAARANTATWTDIMSVTTVGNVGIGNNNPTQKLTVNGNIMLGQSNLFGMSLGDVFSYDGKPQPHYGMQWGADSWSVSGPTMWMSSYGGMKFFTTGVPRMAINDAGNVSIGNAFPVAKLTVWSENADDGAISVQSGSDSRFFIKEGGNVLKIGMVTTGLYPLNVVNNGKVGIGTIAPGDKLTVQDVDGTVTAGIHTVASFIRSGGAASRGVVLGYYADGTNETGAVVRTANGGDLFLQPGAGNVGIGTATTGTYKLAVEGTIGARKVKVTQAAWADFVFDPAYKLPSLAEVENYITANKHLPDVPSAAEVMKDGQDLGEMNRILLKKVEELTLYMIEMKKENEEQKLRLNKLEKQL